MVVKRNENQRLLDMRKDRKQDRFIYLICISDCCFGGLLACGKLCGVRFLASLYMYIGVAQRHWAYQWFAQLRCYLILHAPAYPLWERFHETMIWYVEGL